MPQRVALQAGAECAGSSVRSMLVTVLCVDVALTPQGCHRAGIATPGRYDRPSMEASLLWLHALPIWAEFSVVMGLWLRV